jgi:hypothetical protein
MTIDRPPTAITEDGWHWLRAKHATGLPRSARDAYFPEHDVTQPAQLGEADLPAADNDAVLKLDREALELTYVSGKWVVPRGPDTVDEFWDAVVADVEAGAFWDAKTPTAGGRSAFGDEAFKVAIYTPNYFDADDVQRVRTRLEEVHGVTDQLGYVPDLYTKRGIDAENAEKWGLPSHVRYER